MGIKTDKDMASQHQYLPELSFFVDFFYNYGNTRMKNEA
jgi:hypothetical protein